MTTEHESPIRTGPTSQLPRGLQAPLFTGTWQTQAVMVEVYLDPQDAALHVRAPLSEHPAWRVAFPRELRAAAGAGARFLVEELRPDESAERRGYYRACGRIWEVVDGAAGREVTPPHPFRRSKSDGGPR